jgi:hypothetical protein
MRTSEITPGTVYSGWPTSQSSTATYLEVERRLLSVYRRQLLLPTPFAPQKSTRGLLASAYEMIPSMAFDHEGYKVSTSILEGPLHTYDELKSNVVSRLTALRGSLMTETGDRDSRGGSRAE